LPAASGEPYDLTFIRSPPFLKLRVSQAAKAGMEMRPTKLFIFGNPKGGTPVMLAAPSIAIDLPLKILIWEENISVIEALAKAVAE
jgi:uncharacterized protein (DUF302 family)